MVFKGKTVTRRPWRVVHHNSNQIKRPVKGAFACPWLPKHWKPKDDADGIAAWREELRLQEMLRMSEYDPYAGYTIIW